MVPVPAIVSRRSPSSLGVISLYSLGVPFQDLATADRFKRQIQAERDELQDEINGNNTKKYVAPSQKQPAGTAGRLLSPSLCAPQLHAARRKEEAGGSYHPAGRGAGGGAAQQRDGE